MRVTVVLCTYNRCQLLRRALESVAVSEVAITVEWEVLVVDNNSRDQTPAVAGEFARKYPGRFRYIFEGEPGKSFALNAGIQNSNSDVLAFMDDDVTVDRHWLHWITVVLRDGRWGGAGGRIFPLWLVEPPSWLPAQDLTGRAPLAFFDLGDSAADLAEPPFGTNMAFRREVFQKYGSFRTDLGPRPNSEIRNEDTEFGRRLLKGGVRLRYVPEAIVYHQVPPERINKRYFLAWWFDKGRADVREMGLDRQPEYCVAGAPLYLLRRLAVWAVRWMLAIRSDRRFHNKLTVWMLGGQIVELRRQRRA